MIQQKLRHGNFTSSEIAKLMTLARDGKTFGAPAFTYIAEKNMERRLGRCLTDEINAKPLTWGKLVEQRVFELLGIDYVYSSDQTVIHPNIPYWAGSKDGIKHDEGKTIFDIKSPLTLKSFCQLVDPLYEGLSGMDAMNAIRGNNKEGDTYYWQLVSNSILDNTQFAELIVYMPYWSELDEIKLMAGQVPPDQLSKHYWIAMAVDDELPYLPDEGYYKNVNIIRFEVPLADKILLGKKVQEAGLRLIDPANPAKHPEPVQSALPMQDAISLLKKIS